MVRITNQNFASSVQGRNVASNTQRTRDAIDRARSSSGRVQKGGGIDFFASAGGLGGALAGAIGGRGGAGAATSAASAAGSYTQQAIKELRRQFDLSREDIAPFLEAGVGALPAVQEGATLGGLETRLGDIFNTDIFGSLVGERTRAVEGQLAAGGLTRSGTAIEEAAAIPTDIGLALERLLSGRQVGLAGMGQQAAMGTAQLGAQSSTGIANLLQQQGQDVASGILGAQQARASSTENLINLATTAAGIFFSDPALKQNIKPISHIGDLPLYTWDWIPEAKGTMIDKCATVGFMADEVLEKYPEFVAEYGGFLVINYPALLDELEGYPCRH